MDSPFQAQLDADMDNIFLNFDEFAAPHTIDGAGNIPCIIDDDVSQPLDSAHNRVDGTRKDKILVFVKESTLPKRPKYDQIMLVDRVQWRIINVSLFDGVWELTLEAVR